MLGLISQDGGSTSSGRQMLPPANAWPSSADTPAPTPAPSAKMTNRRGHAARSRHRGGRHTGESRTGFTVYGYEAIVLEEYDPRLDGLQADVLLSLHADSCMPGQRLQGRLLCRSPTPMAGDRILECIDTYYAATYPTRKGPAHGHRRHDGVPCLSQDRPETPAVILELGFMGGDRTLLTDRQQEVAGGVADSLLCFLEQ